MFDRLANGWELAKESWHVLMHDKELLVFPLLSGIACLLVFGSFAAPLWDSPYVNVVTEDHSVPTDPLAYVILFAFYFVNYFVITFFNSALIACAIIRLNGGDPTLADGFSAAMSRLPQIVGWSLVAATVGMILRIIESRSEKFGEFVAGLMGMAWSAAAYFVVPVLVVERMGPIAAVKRSFAILRKTWGETVGAEFGIGLIGVLISLVAIIPAVLGFVMGSTVSIVVGIAISGLALIAVATICSALSGIVIGALYVYAAHGNTSELFDKGLVENAFVER